MVTVIASAKRKGTGYVPMLILRGANGRRMGCKVSHTAEPMNEQEARLDALCAASYARTQFPDMIHIG